MTLVMIALYFKILSLTIGFSDLVRQNCHKILSKIEICPIFSGKHGKMNYNKSQREFGGLRQMAKHRSYSAETDAYGKMIT